MTEMFPEYNPVDLFEAANAAAAAQQAEAEGRPGEADIILDELKTAKRIPRGFQTNTPAVPPQEH